MNARIIGILIVAALLRLYRATVMGDLSEDPYHHWLISAHLASTGSYTDPLSGTAGIWPPGYHFFASGLLYVMGRDILWLKLANILFSLGGIYLVYMIAGKHSKKAGLLAASFLALNPFELLTSSTSYTEPMAVFFFLLAVHLIYQKKENAAGLALLAASATRYEVWLAIPFLLIGKREKKLNIIYLILPSLIFIAAWTAYTSIYDGFFMELIVERNRQVLDYEIGSGAIQGGVIWRTFDIIGYFFISSLPVYAAGVYYAASNIKKGGLFAFALFDLAIVFFITASNAAAGSFRYFSFVLPLLCIYGGIQLSAADGKLVAIIMASLILVLPFYFSLYSGLDSLYGPVKRAGEFVKDTGAGGVLSNSPVPLYYSGLPAARLFGPAALADMTAEQGIRFLREQGIDYVIYVDSPGSDLDRIYPGIAGGENVSGLTLAYDPNGWERMYGAKKVYVYNLPFYSLEAEINSETSVLLYSDTRPHNLKVAQIHKGLVLRHNGEEVIEEGFGFGCPIVIKDNRSFVSKKASIRLLERGNPTVLEKTFTINAEDKSHLPDPVYSDIEPLGTVTSTYSVFKNGSIKISVDFSHLNDADEIYLANEQGARFEFFMDNAAFKRMDGRLGSWNISTSGTICFTDQKGLRFCVNSEGLKYYGREVYPGYLAWSGASIYLDEIPKARKDRKAKEFRVHVTAKNDRHIFIPAGKPVISSPAVDDMDGDGWKEIAIGDWNGTMHLLDYRGNYLRGWPKKLTQGIFSSPAIADIDPEIQTLIGYKTTIL